MKKSAQRDANTARALAVVRFGHRPPAVTNPQTGPNTIHCAAASVMTAGTPYDSRQEKPTVDIPAPENIGDVFDIVAVQVQLAVEDPP